MPREIPPPLEMTCLSALWSLGEGSVSDVRQVISKAHPLAYTTVMTLLDRLARRGFVSRRKNGRAFYYKPAVSRDAMRHTALRQFLDSFFDGSSEELVQFLRRGAEPVSAHFPLEERLDAALL